MLTKRLFRTVIFLFLGLVALSQAQEENLKEAEELYQKALNLNKGRSICSEGLLRQKEYFYRKAIDLSPDYAEAHNNLGDVYENLGMYQEAVTEYKKAVELRPDAEYPYFGLGDTYFKTGRYEEAIGWYEKGLEVNPEDKPSEQKLKEAKDILNQGLIQAETIRSVLARKTTRTAGGIRNASKISFEIPFATNSYKIPSQAIAQLEEIGKAVSSEILSGVSFKIAGHTDSRGSRSYNQYLSEKRAESVRRYLIKHLNISSEKIKAVGYGEDQPVAFGQDSVSYAINRRVEIERLEPEDLVSKPQKLFVDASLLYEKDGKSVKMWSGMTLTSGDNYKVYFSPRQDCYVYICQKDSSRKITRLFPNSLYTSLGNPVRAKEDYWVPRPGKWLYLDKTKGKETIHFVATNEPATDIEYLISKYEKASSEEKEVAALSKEIEERIAVRGLGGIEKVDPSKFSNAPVLRDGSFYKEFYFYHHR